ncbi:AER389Cp [Eremothecium gossypii ATCC 10895]|uniref:AER389Cp n=1 Tax=Eremothecium gossypii (strain ATCC 10895 / CBS 109.51 / FGSC 9923 / NRRL Y-1056) TaxID=284811 RepID=Q755X9_EREGS|nr:AER389Cp [Eremothecium gossypii ATCC 10895]AAS53068.2 AER389Cp [Eremothecium gossypii ATCC 10895]AEY97376.1 FAER389Cp [Eremothecium gossypii FDAG1]
MGRTSFTICEDKVQMDAQQLARIFHDNLKVDESPDVYIKALDELVSGSSVINVEDIEEVVLHCIKDHTESRNHFLQLSRTRPGSLLELLEYGSGKSIPAIVDAFSNAQDTNAVLREIQKLLQDRNRTPAWYIQLIYQLLEKNWYTFSDLAFLVRVLPRRMDSEQVRPLSLVLFARLHSSYPSDFEKEFTDTIDTLAIEADVGIEGSLDAVLLTLTELFPLLPLLCSQLLLKPELQQVLRDESTRNRKTLLLALNLLSVACIDDTVRRYIADNLLKELETAFSDSDTKLYASIVLIKTWAFKKLQSIDIEQLCATCVTELQSPVVKRRAIAVEGLAYLTLKSTVRISIRADGDASLILVQLLKKNPDSSTIYGILSTLVNLTASPSEQSSEQKSLNALKAYADLHVPASGKQEPLEDDDEIDAFIEDYILDLQVIGTLRSSKNVLMANCKEQLAKLIYQVTKSRPFIQSCVKQGATTFLLEYLNDAPVHNIIQILAARALARILINTDPKLLFHRHSPMNSVPALFGLIPILDGLDNEEALSYLTTRDSYEALLALTNLAATDSSEELAKVIVSNNRYWLKLMNCVLDETVQIQRSALELLANLMARPINIAAKFFNLANPESRKNFDTLVCLLRLEDIRSQRAIAAIFANIAGSIPFIAEELLKEDELIKAVILTLKEQCEDEELMQRLLFFIDALLEVSPSKNDSHLLVDNKDLYKTLQKLVITKLPPESFEAQLLSSIRRRYSLFGCDLNQDEVGK